MTRKMLLEQVWEFHFDLKTNIVETHISGLGTRIDRGILAVPFRRLRNAVEYATKVCDHWSQRGRIDQN